MLIYTQHKNNKLLFQIDSINIHMQISPAVFLIHYAGKGKLISSGPAILSILKSYHTSPQTIVDVGPETF
jgi:hypothetical protein